MCLMPGMSQESHPMIDISAVTPAQRARILREESALLEAGMSKGGIDTHGDILVTISMRIDELEGNLAADWQFRTALPDLYQNLLPRSASKPRVSLTWHDCRSRNALTITCISNKEHVT